MGSNRNTAGGPAGRNIAGTGPAAAAAAEVLPTSLGDALDALEQDDVILSALGPHISDSFLSAKRQEFDEYNDQVTTWELERYINRY